MYSALIGETLNRANRGVKVRSLHHTDMDASVMCRQERFELRRCNAVIVIVTVNANVTISTVIICIAMCCTAMYGDVLGCAVLYNAVLYCDALHSTAMYCGVPCCVAVYIILLWCDSSLFSRSEIKRIQQRLS